MVKQVVRTPPETVRTYTDYLLRLFARDPTTERRTLPSGIVDTTFLALDGTYYQAVRTTEEAAGVEVARTVTLPGGRQRRISGIPTSTGATGRRSSRPTPKDSSRIPPPTPAKSSATGTATRSNSPCATLRLLSTGSS